MTTHCSILAWKIPWREEPDGYSPWGHEELDMTEHRTQHKYYKSSIKGKVLPHLTKDSISLSYSSAPLSTVLWLYFPLFKTRVYWFVMLTVAIARINPSS